MAANESRKHCYPIVVIEEGGQYWCYIPDVPGIYGLGPTAEQAKKDILEAARLYLQTCVEKGYEIPHSLARIVATDQIVVEI